ncbi:cell wall / vacuolar inhibitor of fructosidase 1-like [Cicer arietinum]|uniref:Cell wall / vacuolar inhibitor of fructosidase 1-like n=1 Tax=Cicer arietinum TaxID=3827 RepID=A0A1S2YA53_CICAR|nr:cell wall / vacuolar inhibitor of fructosidase 1-like [Cicer arietinum]
MTMLKPLTLLFILILCTTLVVTQSRIMTSNDANLIEKTCNKTQNHTLCLQYLNANPKSSTADEYGLGLIMFDVIRLRALSTIKKIHELIAAGKFKKPRQPMALKSCYDKYKTLLEIDVGNANYYLLSRDAISAEYNAMDIIAKANTCENDFFGRFPYGKELLTDDNNLMIDAATIAYDIIRFIK